MNTKGKNASRKAAAQPATKKRKRVSSQTSIARTIGATAPKNFVEKKNIDNTFSVTSANGAWTTAQFANNIAQSVTSNGRVGRSVVMKSFTMRYVINLPAAAAFLPPSRILVVYDRSPELIAPTAIGDILTSVATYPINGVNNLEHSDRFLILADELPLGAPGGHTKGGGLGYNTFPATAGDTLVAGKMHIKFPDDGLMAIFDSTGGGGVGSIHTGGVFVYFCSQGIPVVTFACTTRVRFADA